MEKTPMTKREKQVIDVIYQLKSATVKEVLAKMDNPPSYSSIRAVMNRLESKGVLVSKEDGPRYVYSPAEDIEKVGTSALEKLVNTFFNGSPLHTMSALLGISAKELSEAQLIELEQAISRARRERDDK